MACPVKDCQLSAKPGQLMCRGHWFATPAPMRTAVNRTWRNYRNDKAAYMEARDAAIAYHDGRSDPTAQADLF